MDSALPGTELLMQPPQVTYGPAGNASPIALQVSPISSLVSCLVNFSETMPHLVGSLGGEVGVLHLSPKEEILAKTLGCSV